jgi:carboxyl-terminal processing protease
LGTFQIAAGELPTLADVLTDRHQEVRQFEIRPVIRNNLLHLCLLILPLYMKKLLCPAFILLSAALYAQPYSAEPLRKKCITLTRFLTQQHYQPLVWSDTAASLFFDNWMNELDEAHVYFTRQDVNQLAAYRNLIADEMRGKGWGFFEESMKLYRKRLQQADSITRVLLSKPADFGKPEKLQWPFTDFSAHTADWVNRWQKIIKWKILDKISEIKGDSLPMLPQKIPANFAALEKIAREKLLKQHIVRSRERLPPSPYFEKNLETAYLNTIAACYDPHTSYMSLSVKKEFETSLSGFEFSTGLDVIKNEKGDWEISRLIPGGAAWRNGDLHAGDVLLKIKTGSSPEKEMAEMSEEMVLDFLQGNSDENLELTIRQKSGVQKTVMLLKEKIEADEGVVKGYLVSRSDKKTGYILLPDFYTQSDEASESLDGCANDVAKEIIKLKNEGMEGLILDLRNNGGGSMWEAVQLAGIFLNEGPMSSIKHKDGKVRFLKDPNRGTIYDGPLIVLINGESASASELVSAVLQDYRRAIIVGGNSFGKGTAQVIMPMDTTILDGNTNNYNAAEDFVKVTNGKFYRVDGSTTQWKGVVPDILLPDIYLSDKFKEKGNSSALKPDNAKKAIYAPLAPLLLGPLAAASNSRVAADSSFDIIRQFANWFKKNAAGFEIPLQWPAFAAMINEEKKMYAAWTETDDSKKPVLQVSNTSFDRERIKIQGEANREANKIRIDGIAADIFVNECVNIMQDWLKLKN